MDKHRRWLQQRFGVCSVYRNVKCKENVQLGYDEVVMHLKNDTYRERVETYRQLKKEGKLEEAAQIKNNLPGILVAGCCEGGHTKANFQSFSGMAMVDIDHISREEAEQFKEVLKALPWVLSVWLSVNHGLKVVVRLEASTIEDYELRAYLLVALKVTGLLQVPVDMACSDVSRVCYVSYDAQAVLKQEAEPLDWTEMLPVAEPVLHVLAEFLRKGQFAQGHRNEALLDLGRMAANKRLSDRELQQLEALVVKHLCNRDLTEKEAVDTIERGHQYAAARPPTVSPLVQKSTSMDIPNGGMGVKELVRRNREIRRNAPYLPEEVFENLPRVMQEMLVLAQSRRERDMLFLAMLACLSGCLPYTSMQYGTQCIYPHLYLLEIASAGSGKGVALWAFRMTMGVHQHLVGQYHALLEKYEEAKLAWELELQQANKQHRLPDVSKRPDPVPRLMLHTMASTSRTQLIRRMAENEAMGLVMVVSELDTLYTAVKSDFGQFSDLLRAFSEHEPVGIDFKTDEKVYEVQEPKLAFVGTGTFEQAFRLLPSQENGLLSRYLFYLGESMAKFRLQEPQQSEGSTQELLKRMAQEVLEGYHHLATSQTVVRFTHEQWLKHQERFQYMLDGMLLEEEEGPASVLYRMGKHMARMAMVLTALRKAESGWEFTELVCTDEDFDRCMKVAEVLLQHGLMYASAMPEATLQTKEMKESFRVQRLLELLPVEFATKEFEEKAAEELGLGRSSCFNLLNRLQEQGSIARMDRGRYCKVEAVEKKDSL